MTIYARSDVCAVNISPAHGGCGTPGGHRRPVINGAPAKVWELNCHSCANHLRHDPHWSPTIADLPETFDEQNARESFEKRGAKDRDAVLAMALARLAGVELPESLTRMISGVPGHVPGTVECAGCGNGQPPGMKFCGECGAAMHGAPPERSLPASRKAAEPAGDGGGKQKLLKLREARLDDLKALSRERGLDESGTRADLVKRLSDAGVTSADYTRFMSVTA